MECDSPAHNPSRRIRSGHSSSSESALPERNPTSLSFTTCDSIYSGELDSAFRSLGVTVLRMPSRSPQANSFCERLIGSARRECLDFMIPFDETHIRQVLKSWTVHYNRGRPHSSLGPGIPEPPLSKVALQTKRHHIPDKHRVSAIPVLGGLHHEYTLEKIAA